MACKRASSVAFGSTAALRKAPGYTFTRFRTAGRKTTVPLKSSLRVCDNSCMKISGRGLQA
eukprot:188705-Alexandrium_andersonii.AAC.1